MGVYIKDLQKPENCDVCPIFLAFTTCGCDRDHCMFQEVTEPHGDLIDRMELLQTTKNNWNANGVRAFNLMINICNSFFDFIIKAPTIIPASKEGKT